jgi:adenosine deaminase
VSPLVLDEFLRALPKVEIHCHLLGTVRHATFLDLAERAKAPLSRAEIDAFYIRGEKPVGVLRALRALDAHLIQRADDLYRLTREYLEDASAHGVRYSEFFWNPTGTARISKIPYVHAQDAIVRAIRDAEKDLSIVGRLIPSIDREAEPRAAVEMVEWVTTHRVPEVLGIGIDYSEVDRPPELFREAYVLAGKAGLKRTAHAGEFGMPWTNVRTAIEVLGVDRVDHGYTVLENSEFARRCAESGIVFTVVPTNSYYLRTLPKERWALDHPIRHMPKSGIRIHPNTDDPTLHHVTPTGAWHMMVKDFGFDLDELRQFMLNGLDAAWVDEDTRRRWRREWTAEFDALRRNMQ